MNAIEVHELEKRFGTFRAVDRVSFSVGAGETFGLLGPNGAGKTTLMRMLAGLSPVNGGRAEVMGLDVASQGRQVRSRLGVVTQSDGLDQELSVRQNLEIFGFVAGLSRARARQRADEVLGFFNLRSRGDDEISELSGGMRRRVAIARALMGSPDVIILDEPSTGLDPESRTRVWEELTELRQTGVTLLMSTHYMDEAEILCDRIAMLDDGRILDIDTPPALVQRHAGSEALEVRAASTTPEQLRAALRDQGIAFRQVGQVLRIIGRDGAPAPRPDLEGAEISVRAPNLEDVFLALAGRQLRAEREA